MAQNTIMPDDAMSLSELSRRRGLSRDRIRKAYAALVASGMPRRLPGPDGCHWKFPRRQAEAWLEGYAVPLAANDERDALDSIAATRAALAAEYGRAG